MGYLRVVKQVPEKFELSGMLFRNADKAAAFEKEYPGRAFTDIDRFLAEKHDMILVLLPCAVLPPYLEKVLQTGIPLLVETPPANTVDGLHAMWELNEKYHGKMQIAEQYFLQPYHKAVRTLADRGVLGEISNLRISMAHDYHGISVMRRLLGESSENCTITAQRFEFPVNRHCGRGGLVRGADNIGMDGRKVASFAYDDGKVGFFDFAGEQYFNYFRSRHLNVQGTQGEINDYTVTYSNGFMPVTAELMRQDMGHNSNLEGYFHRGITWNGEFIYESPFAAYPEARLTDDEIAMGSMLLGMEAMIAGGPEIYPLKEALEDSYLWQKMDEAIRTGTPVRTEKQPWHN